MKAQKKQQKKQRKAYKQSIKNAATTRREDNKFFSKLSSMKAQKKQQNSNPKRVYEHQLQFYLQNRKQKSL